jgi:membrane protein
MTDQQKIKTRLQTLYTRFDEASGGSLEILRDAFERFGETKATQAAAGLAYYTFFSLFPLLLLLISLTSSILQGDQAQQQTISFIQEAVPVSQQLLEQNIDRVLDLRGTVGIIGLVSLLWSASGAFTILSQNINRAWARAEDRNFLQKRLIGFGIIGGIVLLLLLSLASTTLVNLMPQLTSPLQELGISVSSLWSLGARLISWLFTFGMFLALYHWVPNTGVSWQAAAWGAGIAGLGWELAKAGFAWYLRSGLASYELVYGSLGTVVALLFWIFLSGNVALLGAHLSAAVDRALVDTETA